MVIAFLVESVVSPAGTGALGLHRAVVAWLTLKGPITILDVDVWRENSPAYGGLQRARILYSVGGSTDSVWSALVFRSGSNEQTDRTKTASQQFNDQIYSGIEFDAKFFLDITDFGTQYASAETFLVFGVNTAASPLRATFNSNLIGQPVAAILAGASGSVTLLDASGAALGTATVKNVGLTTWAINQRSYVTVDPLSGLWVAISTGVTASPTPLVAPTLTTTTVPQVSTYIAQTKPVG